LGGTSAVLDPDGTLGGPLLRGDSWALHPGPRSQDAPSERRAPAPAPPPGQTVGLVLPLNMPPHQARHWFSVMGMAKCRRLAGKPSACGYIIIDSIHPQMRSMPWNCYRSSAQHATLLSCNLIRRIPPSIMVAVSFTNVRTVLPTFLRQKRLSWQA
jgi:hypothetical protein